MVKMKDPGMAIVDGTISRVVSLSEHNERTSDSVLCPQTMKLSLRSYVYMSDNQLTLISGRPCRGQLGEQLSITWYPRTNDLNPILWIVSGHPRRELLRTRRGPIDHLLA